jgi:hypothetical protein
MSYALQFVTVLRMEVNKTLICRVSNLFVKGDETGSLGGLTKLTVLIHACHNVLFRMTALRKKTMFYLMADV